MAKPSKPDWKDRDPDVALLRRVGEGDGDACAGLVDRHLSRVTALAGRLLRNPTDAEEVAQEVFLRVWRHAGAWREGEALFTTWLHRVTVNLCRDRLRRQRETALEAAGDPPDERSDAAMDMQRKSVAVRVEAALEMLPERQRTAIVLCHYQELGNIEAAAVMEISVEALESLLARGRRKLREILLDEAPDLLGDLR